MSEDRSQETAGDDGLTRRQLLGSAAGVAGVVAGGYFGYRRLEPEEETSDDGAPFRPKIVRRSQTEETCSGKYLYYSDRAVIGSAFLSKGISHRE